MLSDNIWAIKTIIVTKTIELRELFLKKYSLGFKERCWRLRACNFIYRRTIGQILFFETPITQHILQSKMHFINIDIFAVASLLKLPNCKIAARSFYQTDPTSVTAAKEKDVTIQNSLSNFLINDLRIKNRPSVQSWHRSRFGEKTGPWNSSFKLRIAVLRI